MGQSSLLGRGQGTASVTFQSSNLMKKYFYARSKWGLTLPFYYELQLHTETNSTEETARWQFEILGLTTTRLIMTIPILHDS